MVAEFALQCDGCHTVFKAGGDAQREPVTVGCHHTLCRACAEGNKGAYGALQPLVAHIEGDEEGDKGQSQSQGGGDYETDPRVAALVRGRCGVCGGGRGGEIVVRDVVLEAVQGGAAKGEDGSSVQAVEACGSCGGEGEHGEEGGGNNNSNKHAATHFCQDCNKHMCAGMATAHKRSKRTSNHTVHEAPLLLCPTHSQPLLPLFCKDHRCLVCAACVATTHSNHARAKVGDAFAREMKGWLEQWMQRAEARAGELEGVEAGLVEDRDAAIAGARGAMDKLDAVFRELEEKRRMLVEEVIRVRKETCQRLNDVRTTSRVLRQGIAAVQRALWALDSSQSLRTIQHASAMEQQLRELVDISKRVCTQRNDAVPELLHSEHDLRAWYESLSVQRTAHEGEAPTLAQLDPTNLSSYFSLFCAEVLIQRGFGHFIHNQCEAALATFEKCRGSCVARGYQALLLWVGEGCVKKNKGEARVAAAEALAGGLGEKATKGNHHAQLILGCLHIRGPGAKVDSNEAAALFAKAANQGNAAAQTNLGVCFQRGVGVDKDEARAVELFTKAAGQGHVRAQHRLGECFHHGVGVDKDEAKAAEAYTRAADLGYARAQYNLGECFQQGVGVGKDQQKAVELFTAAAAQGYPLAQCSLGECFEDGIGVDKNEEMAAQLYAKAASVGCARAQFNLGECCEYGIGVDKDEERAGELYTKAADLGYAWAQYTLGERLEHGNGTERDAERASHFYRLAAAQDNEEAKEALVRLREQGLDDALVQRGYDHFIHNRLAAALATFKECKRSCVALGYQAVVCGRGSEASAKQAAAKAVAGGLRVEAKGGSHHAQFVLGFLHCEGFGVGRDYSKAAELYARAADQGNAAAQCNLGYCFTCGDGVPKSERRAVEMYWKAASQGHARAQFNLGTCYADGEGTLRDDGRAVELYMLAANQGYSMAQLYLGDRFRNAGNVEQAERYYSQAAANGNDWARERLRGL